MKDNIELKQKQFIAAMELYEDKKIYTNFGKVISILNVSIQIFIIYISLSVKIDFISHLSAFVIAYFLTDFVNGLVHMYMDNNENYESIAGPLIASFHLHHRTPLYKKNNILIVYFNESGSKIWLAVFLIICTVWINWIKTNPIILYIVLYFSILSSVAEVSHYLCHVSNSKIADLFRKTGLLLDKHHHGKHHLEDNVNYAFLNGMSDPLINIIAKKICKGYKNTTDKHYEYYDGKGTKNRN